MEVKNNVISKDTYSQYVSSGMELKDIVEKLKGKIVEDEYRTIEDCAVDFVGNLLGRDWGRSIVYVYNKKESDFISSKYLSDYFKDSISQLLDGTKSKEIETILNSDKDINEMSEEDIKMMYDAIVEYYHINRKSPKPNISSKFLTYLYKLDGKGISSFLKNNIDGETIARQILLTSGLNDRASYYSGRGVMYCDLNEKNLVPIFEKLLKLDINYAVEFVEMVRKMETLGATEFINSFIGFANKGFKSDSLKTENSNISLDGVHGEARDTIAFISIFSAMSRGNDTDYQVRASEQMKNSFISIIRPALIKINPEFDKIYEEDLDSYEQGWNPYGYRKRI